MTLLLMVLASMNAWADADVIVKEIGNLKSTIEDAAYDLQGRRINGVPQKNGVYIKGNRKEK